MQAVIRACLVICGYVCKLCYCGIDLKCHDFCNLIEHKDHEQPKQSREENGAGGNQNP